MNFRWFFKEIEPEIPSWYIPHRSISCPCSAPADSTGILTLIITIVYKNIRDDE
jgi:hypothetical protein